jgi:hypothetical protein
MNKKNKKLLKLLQKPLRFHHMIIHDEIDAIRQQLDLQNELLACIAQALVQTYPVVNASSQGDVLQLENADS